MSTKPPSAPSESTRERSSMPSDALVGTKQLAGYAAHRVSLRGFVHVVREHKARVFVILRDATGLAQLLIQDNPELVAQARALPRESVIRAHGLVVANPAVRLNGCELIVARLEVVSAAESPLPLQPGERKLPGPEHRLDWRFLDLRRPENRLIFDVQAGVERAMRAFFARESVQEIHTPKLMAGASESGAQVFGVDYFGRAGCLAQSPQFYKQMAIAAGFDRVFEVGPVFRAEQSFTNRHTTEFTGVDVELAWIESVDDVMAFEEAMLCAVLEQVVVEYGEAVETLLGVQIMPPSRPFPRLSLAEALALIGVPEGANAADLTGPQERALSRQVQKQFGHDFVFVTGYCARARPFYHMRGGQEEAGLVAASNRAVPTRSFDLLWRGIEITTGAQREHRANVLAAQAIDCGVAGAGVSEYLDFFKYGCPPHGGFGLGLARLVMLLLERDSVRDTTFLPRTPNRLTP